MSNNSSILILGAKSDIAKAIATVYADEYPLILAGRNIQVLKNFASDLILHSNQRIELVEFDASAFETHDAFWNSITSNQNISVVISALGYMGDVESSLDSFHQVQKVMNANLMGCISILNRAARYFEKHKSGSIIGISSVAGDRGRSSNMFYGSAKSAFSAYLSGLRQYLAPKGVHVLTVKPGFVRTKMTENLSLNPILTSTPEVVAKRIKKAHSKRSNIIYVYRIWWVIMAVIKSIPEFLFKKLSF